jgi:hypothetical protein
MLQMNKNLARLRNILKRFKDKEKTIITKYWRILEKIVKSLEIINVKAMDLTRFPNSYFEHYKSKEEQDLE